MDKDLIVDLESIEVFVEKFFKNPYIAGWVGIFVPQMYDLREYVLNNMFSANLKLIKILFPENLIELYEKGYDEIIPINQVAELVKYVLSDFDRILNYKKNQNEIFYLELIFQLPFIWNSRFNKSDRLSFIASKKEKYDSTFRQNLKGSIIIGKNISPKYFLRNEINYRRVVLKKVKCVQDQYNIHLLMPEKLERYWSAFLEKTSILLTNLK